MLRNNYFIIFVLLLIKSNILFAQEESSNYTFVSIKEGISKRAVYTIVEDSHKFKWIGTNGAGIFRFDGINYKSYTYDWNDETSVDSNIIYCAFIDDDDQLWVGTNNGLNLYNRNLDKFERIDLNLNSALNIPENISIQCISQDKNGNILLGTLNLGILKLEKESLKVLAGESAYRYLSNGFSINAFAKNAKGHVYAATNLGLKLFNDNKNILEDAVFVFENDSIKISEPLESIIIDDNDHIWLGTNTNGVIKITEGNYKVSSFPVTEKRIMSMLYAEGKILCGTENDGLIVLNENGNVIEHDKYNKFDEKSLRSNSIWSLCLDADNRIWLGYYNKGIGVYDKLYNKFSSLESLASNHNSLQAGSVTGIEQDKSGRLWISMEGGGVDVYNLLDNTFQHINSENEEHYKGLKGDYIQTVFIDSNENVWLGSWSGGVYFLKKGTKTFVNYNKDNTNGGISSNKIISITEDSRGFIWIATFFKGLHYYNPKLKTFTHCNSQPFKKYDLTNSSIRVVFTDSNDNVWLGTDSGLFKVKLNKDGAFTVVSLKELMSTLLKEHPSTHQIQSIYESKDGRIWIGTDGGGLFVYDTNTKHLSLLNNIEDFNEKSISSIIESNDGMIWLGSKTGLISLDLKVKKAKNYTMDDGLLSNDFNINAVHKDNDNILYFGSYLGVNYFNPNKIPVNKSEPSLHFTGFKLFNQDVTTEQKKSPLDKVISETERLTLTHEQSVFTIEYVGINYTRPEKNQYAYFLEGLDVNWNYVGNIRSATYTNLAPGDYIFKVKATNNDGIWNAEPLELKIKVLPPWWKTSIAYFIYFIFSIFGLLGFNRVMSNRLKKRQSIQLEKDRRLQEEELNENKFQFFTNISHEFRTPLTLILNPIADIINDKSLKIPLEVKKKHQIIYKNSDRLSRLINELLDFRKLQSNKIQLEAQEVKVSELIYDMVSYFEQEAVSRKIKLNYHEAVGELAVWLDPNMVEKIMFNLISNAFKVTPNNGEITVIVKQLDHPIQFPLIDENHEVNSAVTISVEDTGPGLDQKEYKRIFERFYQVGNLNKSYYGSTGIGLKLVKDFVELHRGKIEVKSNLGKGTKFTVFLPIGKSHLLENELVTNRGNDEYLNKQIPILNEPIDDNEQAQGIEKKHTLLIVEDNIELQDYLKNELKKEYKIITAINGEKGLEITKKELPNIIITDVVMPIMDGLKMCKSIKGDMSISHIPLLMLTAKAMVKDKLEGIDSGADAYLNKPFNMSILKSKLAQLLRSREILFEKHYQGITKESEEKTTSLDSVFIKKV